MADVDNQVYQVTPVRLVLCIHILVTPLPPSVPWFPQGTVAEGPGHMFVLFLVAFVQVGATICHQYFTLKFAHE